MEDIISLGSKNPDFRQAAIALDGAGLIAGLIARAGAGSLLCRRRHQ